MTRFAPQIYRQALLLDADLYQIYDPELLPYARRLKRRGKAVVFDSRELYAVLLRSKYYLPCRSLASALYGRYERFCLRRLDQVIFPAAVQGRDVYPQLAEKTTYLANYALLDELYADWKPVEKQSDTACFVGVMTVDRGIEAMIRAAHRAGFRLTLVGDIEPPAYEEKLRQMPEFSCVEKLPPLSREETRAVYERCAVGLCAIPNGGQYNIADTLNMKVYDYMAMGLACVLTDCPYTREVLSRYPCGVAIDPADTDGFAEALRQLAAAPQKLAEMGAAGRRAIAEEFNWTTQERRLLSLYRRLLGQEGERRE